MNVEWCSPLLEHRHWDVLDLPGGDKEPSVDRTEASGPDQPRHGLPRLLVVPGDVDLLAALQTPVL